MWKKKTTLIMSLILAITLITGCNKAEENGKFDEEIVVKEVETGRGVRVEYAIEDEEDIFGDSSKEEINEIIDGIFDKLSKDDQYKENIDLAIEEVFEQYGITDVNKLESAKNKIVITLK